MRIPERVSWAVDLLQVQPDMRVLEIGCGRGHAARVLTPLLGANGYVGIDRSKVAIQAARKLNAEAEARGIATFHLGAFEEIDVGAKRFDAALAINVNAFWMDDGEAAAASLALLKKRGKLLLVFEPPSPGREQESREQEITDAICERVKFAGFRTWTPTKPLERSKAWFAVWARAG